MDNAYRDIRHILIADFKRYIRPLEDRNAAGDALNWADYTLATMRNRLLESGEWREVECDCDNWLVCKNHHDMAERLDIDSLDLLRILAEIKEEMMTEQAYGERTRWDHRYSEFEQGTLVRQKNGTWRITISRVCGGSNCGPRNGVAHDHRATNTMTEQEVVNLLLDWDHDLEEAKGLANYV